MADQSDEASTASGISASVFYSRRSRQVIIHFSIEWDLRKTWYY